MLATCSRINSFITSNKIKSYSNSVRKNSQDPLKCPTLSIEKGTKITQAIASELVSLNGNKDVFLHEILNGSCTGDLFVSTQLTIKLPLLSRSGGHAALCAVFLLCRFGLIMD